MKQCTRVLLFALVACVLLCVEARAQEESTTTMRGRVLNAVTKEPVSRALVVLQTTNAAAFTDDGGQFELKFAEKNQAGNASVGRTFMSGAIEARKPGFLPQRRLPMISYTLGPNSSGPPPATIYLMPEALIVGHVEVPGSEGDVRIQCQLYRRVTKGGTEFWSPQSGLMTWADGEFRFSELEAGTYKLITHEQIDPDSATTPGAPLFVYPPVYYPHTTDFSIASPIVVKAGETARVNLAVARREYFPVKITVANMPVGRGLNVVVYPMGHRSPGWSLGYEPGEGSIVGSLPDGSYTIEATVPGDGEMSGVVNFSVKGAPVEGPRLTLVPDATVSVTVREQFQSEQSNFAAAQTIPGNSRFTSRRTGNVQVSLTAIDALERFARNASSQLTEGSEGQELSIPNVGPGRYGVEVTTRVGYPASVQCGGKDLMRQPLVVGLGGSVAPIEVVLRDDGAEIDGEFDPSNDSANDEQSRIVYLVPTVETGGQPRTVVAWGNHFMLQQIPPGDYVLLASAGQREDVPYGNEEGLQGLLNKGAKMVHLEAKQRANVKVPVVANDGE